MKSQYFRTFIALPLHVDTEFIRARNELVTSLGVERISWTNPDQYHVTLRFIGDTGLDDVKKIGNALHAGIHIPERIRLNLTDLSTFGPRKKPRVIWVGFEETSFFGSVKKDVDAVLEQCGIPANEQPFRAHLTLGRVRSLGNLQEYYHVLEEMKHRFFAPVLFENMVFFRSIPGQRGPEYRVLKELRFR